MIMGSNTIRDVVKRCAELNKLFTTKPLYCSFFVLVATATFATIKTLTGLTEQLDVHVGQFKI
ncbi:MAG: hypothetical protein ACI8WB_002011 [Phenylobacterium sp.]|jgi:hypothetical protein